MKDKYPNTREIIYLLGLGFLLTSSILIPGAAFVAKEIIKIKNEDDFKKAQKEWRKFNLNYLKRNLKRLNHQKIVQVVKVNNEELIQLTKKGRTRFLRFNLENLSRKSINWDRKWRIIIYDISKFKKDRQEKFRRILKSINFLQLQKSVYLSPYPCEEQISYLREYFNIGEEVVYIRADMIENEGIYKEYFGI